MYDYEWPSGGQPPPPLVAAKTTAGPTILDPETPLLGTFVDQSEFCESLQQIAKEINDSVAGIVS